MSPSGSDTPTRLGTATGPRILPRQMVPTRDGVQLCTDVYLPTVEPPVSAVVVRTPYGRNLPMLLKLAVRLNQAGLATVIQDCRGRYQSGGRYDFLREPDDTYDTLTWMSGEPWSNGHVALYGMSVSSFANFRVAARPLPESIDLAAMVSIMGLVHGHAMIFPGGAFNLHWSLPWTLMMNQDRRGRTDWQQLPWERVFRHLPIETALETWGGEPSKEWAMLVRTARRDPAWDELDCLPYITGLSIPTLHVSGWFDFMLPQALMGYQAMVAGDQDSPSASPQKLVVGPWDHGTLFTAWGGSKDTREGVDLLELVVYWCARWLLPEPGTLEGMGSFDRESDVLLWLEGVDSWLKAESFPVPESDSREWFLSGRGAREQGELLRSPPTETDCNSFHYDPEDPVPTLGGAVWPFPSADIEPGPKDQSLLLHRPDVLIYTSPPLEEDLVLLGPAEMELWAASSARDTDFTAKLVEVDRLGTPRVLQDGIVRARFRKGPEQEKWLEPHRACFFSISLGSVARRIPRGHRLSVHISSSNFPKFDRNPNTAQAWGQSTITMTAQQTIYHGGTMPSRLRLTVISSEELPHLESRELSPWRLNHLPSETCPSESRNRLPVSPA